MYLFSQNVHGPRFTSPKISVKKMSESLDLQDERTNQELFD